MLAPPVVSPTLDDSPQQNLLPAELEFYGHYDWCLNPYLTVTEAITRLRGELSRLETTSAGWQQSEIATNIFLLSCGLLNCIDEQLRGAALRLPKRLAAATAAHVTAQCIELVSDNHLSRRRIIRWREQLLSRLHDFLFLVIHLQHADPKALVIKARRLAELLQISLPSSLHGQRLGTPTPFNRLDLTHIDFLSLGKSFVRRFPDRAIPLAIVGLRTSGSYFAPLLKAYLQTEGFQTVAFATIEPNKGIGLREGRALARLALQGYTALIVDDPPHTNRTVLAALNAITRVGFSAKRIKFLAATHPAKRAWFKWIPEENVVTLPPEEWYKKQLLNAPSVQARLVEYLGGEHLAQICVTESWKTDEFNAHLAAIPTDERSVRLKRIFEIRLKTREGTSQTKYVLAKSVGWGWFGYHAFLIGHKLAGLVPPILGLRDGILYMEWIPQQTSDMNDRREELLSASASYIAARARELRLTTEAASIDLQRYNNGLRLLEKALSRAYGPVLIDRLVQGRIGALMRKQPRGSPSVIDGNMHPREWIMGPRGLLKTDYEHHGMGKAAINLTDPAYDLAETILNMSLLPDEERKLIEHYVTDTGDASVEQRLFVHKLVAALWAMNESYEQLFGSARGRAAQLNYHQRFMNAWHFLIVHAARHCGALCHKQSVLRWRAPLIVLDIDGVIDRRVFGFPCTTVAGIKALSLLRAHDFSVAVNTARSTSEVKAYCAAYSLTGGIAEHGSYVWDAIGQRERVLVSREAARQLEVLRRHLQEIPGIFLDDRHQYSIRAFTYREKPLGILQSVISSARASVVGDGALAPISTHVVHELLTDLRLDRLTFHHTLIDTAIVAKENDKAAASSHFAIGH